LYITSSSHGGYTIIPITGEINRGGQFRYAAVPGGKFAEKEYAGPQCSRSVANDRCRTRSGRK